MNGARRYPRLHIIDYHTAMLKALSGVVRDQTERIEKLEEKLSKKGRKTK